MSATEDLDVAKRAMQQVVDHLRVLEADADAQIAWLHPCGWTRDEPFGHVEKHPPCAPIDELWCSFDDMWPTWRPTLMPVLNPPLEDALTRLHAALDELDTTSFVDDIATLDRPEWAQIRLLAAEARRLGVPRTCHHDAPL